MASYEDYKQLMINFGCNPLHWTDAIIEELEKKFTKEELKTYKRKLNAFLQKRCRIRSKLSSWKELYFITLTINNDNLEKSRRTFTDKIKLIFENSNYIANEDFGKENGRLHYHVICEENKDLSLWKYGYTLAIKCKRTKSSIDDNFITEKRLASYLTKLANHCVKESSGKIIYGRKKIK